MQINAKLVTTSNLTLFTAGEQITIPSDHPDYNRALELLAQSRDDEVYALATKYRAGIKDVMSVVFKNVTVTFEHGTVLLNGKSIEGTITDRIVTFAQRGIPQKALMAFLARVQRNPDIRAREDLFNWIETNNMPITADGCFIAFKIVRNDYWDIYTGTTFLHTVGSIVEMPRDEVDDNPEQTCSRGAHFCAENYIPLYGTGRGDRIVTLKIAPEDVVAFPTDYNLAKGRAFRYEVIGEMSRDDVEKYLGSINRSYVGDGYDDEEEYEDYKSDF